MSKKQIIMLLSWCFVGLALYVSGSNSDDIITTMMLGNVAIAVSVWIRELFLTESEVRYWESILALSNRFTVVGFIYMFAWLVYILYEYFTNIDKSEIILSDTMLVLFLAPIILIVVFHELFWFTKSGSQGST